MFYHNATSQQLLSKATTTIVFCNNNKNIKEWTKLIPSPFIYNGQIKNHLSDITRISKSTRDFIIIIDDTDDDCLSIPLLKKCRFIYTNGIPDEWKIKMDKHNHPGYSLSLKLSLWRQQYNII